VLLGGTRHHEQTLRRPCWPDRRPGHGPLVSLWGLLADVGRDVVALPCDLPEVTPEHVRALVHRGAPKLARVGCIDGRPAYPIGWWSSAIIPTFATATNNGIRSFREALAGVSAGLDSVDLVGIDDVDDPDQLRRLGYPPPHD